MVMLIISLHWLFEGAYALGSATVLLSCMQACPPAVSASWVLGSWGVGGGERRPERLSKCGGQVT